MAVDGVGILDSDLAHDLYNEILDLYDAGLDLKQIENNLPTYEECVLDDMDRDIYLTAKAQAYWEIGLLSPELLAAVVRAVEDDKGSLVWKNQCGESEYKARKRILDRFLKNVSIPKREPRLRRKYAKIKNKLFRVGDCLILPEGRKTHKGVVCQIDEYRDQCNYAILVMEPSVKPDVPSFIEGHFIGRRIPSTAHDMGFVFSPAVVTPEHRMILKEEIPFQVIGNIKLDSSLYGPGSCGGVLCKKDVVEEFDRVVRDRQVFGEDLIPLKEIMRGSGASR